MMSELISIHNMFILWLKNGSKQQQKMIVLIAINLIAFIKIKKIHILINWIDQFYLLLQMSV